MKTIHSKLSTLVTLLIIGALVGSACSTLKQSKVRMGILTLLPAMEPIVTGLKEGMESQGYKEGDDIEYIYNGPANEVGNLDAQASQLVEANVDIIVAVTTPGAQAAQRAVEGTDIPIVFIAVTDPIAAELVTDLGTHDENITGILAGAKASVSEGRRLEIFVQMIPSMQTLYLPFNPDDPAAKESVIVIREAGSTLGISFVDAPVHNEEEALAATIPPNNVDGVFLPSDRLIGSVIEAFIKEANTANLPTTLNNPAGLELGALMAYGPDFKMMGQQGARLASQVLMGTPAGSLPVEVPELLIGLNLATAEKIDLYLSDEIIRLANIITR